MNPLVTPEYLKKTNKRLKWEEKVLGCSGFSSIAGKGSSQKLLLYSGSGLECTAGYSGLKKSKINVQM